jgi:hypothetical protein
LMVVSATGMINAIANYVEPEISRPAPAAPKKMISKPAVKRPIVIRVTASICMALGRENAATINGMHGRSFGARTWQMAKTATGMTNARHNYVRTNRLATAAPKKMRTNPANSGIIVTPPTAMSQHTVTTNAAPTALLHLVGTIGARTCLLAMSATGQTNALARPSVTIISAVPSTICTNPAVETASVTRHTATIQ